MIILVRSGADGTSCLVACVFICFSSLMLGHVDKNIIPSTHPIDRNIGQSTICSVETLFRVNEYVINPIRIMVISVVHFEVNIWHMNLWSKDSVCAS